MANSKYAAFIAAAEEGNMTAAAQKLGACFPDADVSVVNGGQPVYYYMISIE